MKTDVEKVDFEKHQKERNKLFLSENGWTFLDALMYSKVFQQRVTNDSQT